MKKSVQLIIFVAISFLIVIICWYFIVLKKDSFNFAISPELSDLKNDLTKSFKSTYPQGINLKEGIDNLKKTLSQQQEIKNEEIKKELVAGILSQISTTTVTSSQVVLYQHEPWKVSFDYNSKMNKSWDVKKQELFFYYDSKDANILIKKQELKEKTFNAWLAKNYDLQKLNKRELNGLIFWEQDVKDVKFKIKEDYLNIGKDLYIFKSQDVASSTVMVDSMNMILNSFKKY